MLPSGVFDCFILTWNYYTEYMRRFTYSMKTSNSTGIINLSFKKANVLDG